MHSIEEEGKGDRKVERADEPEVARTIGEARKVAVESHLSEANLADAGRPRQLKSCRESEASFVHQGCAKDELSARLSAIILELLLM